MMREIIYVFKFKSLYKLIRVLYLDSIGLFQDTVNIRDNVTSRMTDGTMDATTLAYVKTKKM